jgi:hypothetical protein
MPQPSYFSNGAFGVVSTAADLGKWLIAQKGGGMDLKGVRVLPESAIAAMHTPSAPNSRYGFGWNGLRSSSDSRIEHLGWTPTFTAYQALVPSHDMAVAVMENAGRSLGVWNDAGLVGKGIISLEQGGSAESLPRTQRGDSSYKEDWVLALLTLGVVALGLLGVWRARSWSERFLTLPSWKRTLRLAPHVLLIVLIAVLPKFLGPMFYGRGATWLWIAYVAPAISLFLWTCMLASSGVLLARACSLYRKGG